MYFTFYLCVTRSVHMRFFTCYLCATRSVNMCFFTCCLCNKISWYMYFTCYLCGTRSVGMWIFHLLHVCHKISYYGCISLVACVEQDQLAGDLSLVICVEQDQLVCVYLTCYLCVTRSVGMRFFHLLTVWNKISWNVHILLVTCVQ